MSKDAVAKRGPFGRALRAIAITAAIALFGWQSYLATASREVGIPGWFVIELGSAPSLAVWVKGDLDTDCHQGNVLDESLSPLVTEGSAPMAPCHAGLEGAIAICSPDEQRCRYKILSPEECGGDGPGRREHVWVCVLQ